MEFIIVMLILFVVALPEAVEFAAISAFVIAVWLVALGILYPLFLLFNEGVLLLGPSAQDNMSTLLVVGGWAVFLSLLFDAMSDWKGIKSILDYFALRFCKSTTRTVNECMRCGITWPRAR